jgi:hypothetical protein
VSGPSSQTDLLAHHREERFAAAYKHCCTKVAHKPITPRCPGFPQNQGKADAESGPPRMGLAGPRVERARKLLGPAAMFPIPAAYDGRKARKGLGKSGPPLLSVPRSSNLSDAPPYGLGRAFPLYCYDQPLEPRAKPSAKGAHMSL